jgi:signal transduction histidine kinase
MSGKGFIDRLLAVESAGPDDARRRYLLNVLLVGFGALTAVALLITAIGAVTGFAREDAPRLLPVLIAVLATIALLYAANRRVSGAAWAFLGSLILVFLITDSPEEVVNGRSLFLFTLPVVMASVVLHPAASFAVAGAAGVAVSLLSLHIAVTPNYPAVIGFFVVALASFLSARSLERALAELRATNAELDSRVADRTRELAEALDEVAAEAAKNLTILDSIGDGVILFDRSGAASAANPAVSGLMGREDVAGRGLAELMEDAGLSAEDRGELTDLFMAEGGTANVRVDWGGRVLSVGAAPVRGAQDGKVVVFRDVTGEAQLERAKTALISASSHELRTPLNAVIGYAEMALEEGGPHREHLSRILANARRLLGLVNNLLDRAQLEAGQFSIRRAPFATRAVFEEVAGTMSVLAEAKGLKLSARVENDVPAQLTGDAGRLRQIAINLLGNAVKFTDAGEVALRVFHPGAKHWAFSVSDTGVGIPEDARDAIFAPYRRAAGSEGREGTGLGLSITKELVERMGGRIEVESQVGKGSTFTVTLPVKPQE